jgi:hypothetical protein
VDARREAVLDDQERAPRDHGERAGDEHRREPLRPPAVQEAERRRPDEVELLLLRERPHRRQLERERAAQHAHDVRREDRADGDALEAEHAQGVLADREREPTQQRGHEHDAGERRQQPAGPAAVEGTQRDAAGRLVLLDQQRRDQEAGEDEEEVDAADPVQGGDMSEPTGAGRHC